jgi:large subunit ribosomal protein L16
MLMPKRMKYRKQHRGAHEGSGLAGATVAFSEYGRQALESCWVTRH